MTEDETARRAAELGLEKLAERHPDDLRKALEMGERLSDQIKAEFRKAEAHWTEEPAHTFSLAPRREERR